MIIIIIIIISLPSINGGSFSSVMCPRSELPTFFSLKKRGEIKANLHIIINYNDQRKKDQTDVFKGIVSLVYYYRFTCSPLQFSSVRKGIWLVGMLLHKTLLNTSFCKGVVRRQLCNSKFCL